jgi:hypothetical protein
LNIHGNLIASEDGKAEEAGRRPAADFANREQGNRKVEA